MAVANAVNRAGLVKLLSGDINWKNTGGSLVKCMLINDSFQANTGGFKNTCDYLNDVSGYNPTGGSTKAPTLQVPQVAAGVVYLDPSTASLVFSTVSVGTVGGYTTFKSSGAESASPLITLNAFTGGNITANGSDIQVSFHANGIAQITISA